MEPVKLVRWNRKEKKAEDGPVSINKADIAKDKEGKPQVLQRYYRNASGSGQFEGTVVKMNDGTEHFLANLVGDVRRALGIISTPAGSDPVRTN